MRNATTLKYHFFIRIPTHKTLHTKIKQAKIQHTKHITLKYNTFKYLAIGFLSFRSNRIDLVNEDDRGGVLLGLLECLPQVALTLSRQFAHYLGSVYQEEESSRLVCHRPRDQSLT